MKKIGLVLLVMTLMLSFTACGKSEAAQATDDLIASIGEVTLDSESKIVAAESAVEVLSDKDREQLEMQAVLIAARAEYDSLVAKEKEKEMQEKASQVDEAIMAIGTVTADSETTIAAARSAYDALEEEAKAFVANANVLTDAENALSDLRAQNVVALIDAIGTVTLESGDRIQAAKDAMGALSAEDAAKVSNAATLETAASELAALKKQEGENLLKEFRLEQDVVRGLQFYYPMAFPYYTDYWGADVRCFALPYLGKSGDEVWLRLVCNYTEDDWVFFEKITFAVDDARYYETFSYYDVTRDNSGGDVWEYVDMEVYDSEIEMLWAIANSTQTIIRFEGDDYYYDFTVTDKDKKAIREILTAYEALAQ